MIGRVVLAGFLLTGLLAWPLTVTVAAHEGHGHKIMGTVSALHEKHLVVRTKNGKTETILLTEATKILRGKTRLRIADVKTGDRVVVNVGAGRPPLTATEVLVGAASAPAGKP
jgi:hypothetical protein